MPTAYFIAHPDVVIDPAVPVTDWPLSPRGRERMGRFAASPLARGIRTIWSSKERKARDAAEILAKALGLSRLELEELGENDRSATGYLPKLEFEALADLFFAHPETSVRGWERAVDAQRRIIAAMERVLREPCGGDIAIVSHGAVGALFLAALKGCGISREHDQPPGSGGGSYYSFNIPSRILHHGWKSIDG
jgi:broad specificity phosphatase PhoE